MAVTSRDLHNTSTMRRQVTQPITMTRSYNTLSRAPYAITVLLCVIAVVLVANSVITWGQIKLDDMRYGRPRTMQLAGFVGHNEGTGVPTQFVAMNLNRRVVVFEIPGGDASQTRTLTGPYLFGAHEDLTPVRLRLQSVNTDNNMDLVISVKNEEIIYINEGGSFRLINADERISYEKTRQ